MLTRRSVSTGADPLCRPALREEAAVHRSWLLALILLVITPHTSNALQLHWSTGAMDMTFTSATRCTLVVQADPAETRLPRQWRLLWVADSASVQFVATDSVQACQLEEAQVSEIEGPETAADSTSHAITARFCSEGSIAAIAAQQIVDLPAFGHGKFKVVALDPSDPDSSRVIESNDATYNGGIEGSYAPLILHASSVHQSLQLRVTAVGYGLTTANSMNIMATDSSWTLPLTVTGRSNAFLTGVASVAAILPACQAAIGSESGAVSATTLPADDEPPLLGPESGGCTAQYFEELLPPPALSRLCDSAEGFCLRPRVRGFDEQPVCPASLLHSAQLLLLIGPE